MKKYKVIHVFSAFNRTTLKTKEFAIGDIVEAQEVHTPAFVGFITTLQTSDGFILNVEDVEEMSTVENVVATAKKPSFWIYAAIAIVIAVAGYFLIKRFKK